MYAILPILILTSFKNVTINNLQCPSIKEPYMGEREVVDEIKLTELDPEILKSSHAYLSGIDCYLEEKVTDCKSYLFSENVVRYTTKITLPNKEECNRIQSSGEHNYLSPNCEWHPFDNTWTSVSSKKTIVRERRFQFDYLKGTIVHQEKMFDECHGDYCVYRESKGLWISKDMLKENITNCDENDYEVGNIITAKIVKFSNQTALEFQNHIINEHDICILRRCRENLYVLNDHTIFAGSGTNYFKQCKQGSITLELIENSLDILESEIECHQKITDMMKDNKVLYNDLKFFQPNSIGVHNIYRWSKNNKIEVALGYYTKVRYDSKGDLLDSQWIKCGNYSECGHNGIIRFPRHINLTNTLYKLHKEEILTKIYQVFDDNSTLFGIYEEEEYQQLHSVFNSLLKSYYIYIGEFLLIILIIFFIFSKCNRCIKCGAKRRLNIRHTLKGNVNPDYWD